MRTYRTICRELVRDLANTSTAVEELVSIIQQKDHRIDEMQREIDSLYEAIQKRVDADNGKKLLDAWESAS